MSKHLLIKDNLEPRLPSVSAKFDYYCALCGKLLLEKSNPLSPAKEVDLVLAHRPKLQYICPNEKEVLHS